MGAGNVIPTRAPTTSHYGGTSSYPRAFCNHYSQPDEGWTKNIDDGNVPVACGNVSYVLVGVGGEASPFMLPRNFS